jgi:hypothetical protein
MASSSVSVPPYFCTICQKQFKPQGFASHHQKCLQRLENEKCDRTFEANLNREVQEARHHSTAGGEFSLFIQLKLFSLLMQLPAQSGDGCYNPFQMSIPVMFQWNLVRFPHSPMFTCHDAAFLRAVC